jgi:uncharacterized protein YdeI (YjbR/CyaY-like superfamily)
VTPAADLPELIAVDAGAWRAWLRDHHDSSPGVWLVLAKRGVVEPTRLTFAEALDEALCHGWIDGTRHARDATTFAQRFTPRRARSTWSQRNVGSVERLTAEGRMHGAGVAEVDRAKADGRWDAAYAGSSTIEVPEDLAAALAAKPRAAAMFDILTSQNRFAVLYRVQGAKRADTRQRRIDQFVTMLANGETPHPQKKRLDD